MGNEQQGIGRVARSKHHHRCKLGVGNKPDSFVCGDASADIGGHLRIKVCRAEIRVGRGGFDAGGGVKKTTSRLQVQGYGYRGKERDLSLDNYRDRLKC